MERKSLPRKLWEIIRESGMAYMDDGALSKGAAIAYYTVTSIAPVLIIVIAIAGLAFGQEAARGAISSEVSGLMGKQSADVLESAVKSASSQSAGIIASIIGIVTLIVTASGVFGEMQTALNAIWRAEPHGTTVSRLVRARLASLGLVGALGFLLLVSLVVSAGITALGHFIDNALPFGALILHVVSFIVSYLLVTLMFGAIYKVLPDRELTWRDVMVGAAVTGLLFTIGKMLIGIYLGSSSMASSYGAAGGLLIMLVWIYYSAQIFLLGAEFTKVYASNYGSLVGTEAAHSVAQAADEPVPDAVRGPNPDPTRYPDARDRAARGRDTTRAQAGQSQGARAGGRAQGARGTPPRRGLVAPDPAPALTRVIAGFFLLRALSGAARGLRRP
jgi:membrane protein